MMRRGVFSGNVVERPPQVYFKRKNICYDWFCLCFLRFFRKPNIVATTLLCSISIIFLLTMYNLLHSSQLVENTSPDLAAAIASGNKTLLRKLFPKYDAEKATAAAKVPTSNSTDSQSFFNRKVGGRYLTLPPGGETAECTEEKPFDNQKKFVVFSCLMDFYRHPENDCINARDYSKPCSCVFGLPIAVAAWRRFDYDAIIFLLSKPGNAWKQRKAFSYVLSVLDTIDRVHIYLVPIDQPGNDEGNLLAAIRFFAAKFVNEILNESSNSSTTTATNVDPYIVAVDVPFHPSSTSPINIYEPVEKGRTDVNIVLPDGCCPKFYLDGELVRILPTSGVGMRASKWREILGFVEEPVDIIREIRAIIHMTYSSVGLYENAEPTTIGKVLTISLHKWINANEAGRKCRIEEVQMKPSDTRVFHLPVAIQSVGIWKAVREMIRAQVNPADVLDIDSYFRGYLQTVGEEKELEAPLPEAEAPKNVPDSSKSPENVTKVPNLKPKTPEYNDSPNFLPLENHLEKMRTLPYKGLGPVNAGADPMPVMFDQILQPPKVPRPVEQTL